MNCRNRCGPMLKWIAPFARTNGNKNTPKPMKPSTIISASAYPNFLVNATLRHYRAFRHAGASPKAQAGRLGPRAFDNRSHRFRAVANSPGSVCAASYTKRMIKSCKNADTQKLVNREFCKRFSAIEKAARMRLDRLKAARFLSDLAIPGHRLEKLAGDR